MGVSTSFQQIQKQYGQDGVQYVTFRYHERRTYYKIKEFINSIKDKIDIQQQNALKFIDHQKMLLQQEFKKAKNEAQTRNPDSIKIAEMQCKQPVEDFSGFNFQLKRLQNLHQETKKKYESQKQAILKRIRYEIMRQQNKSNLKGIKQFDKRSDSQRKYIEQECIRRHPQKELQQPYDEFSQKFVWQRQRQVFDSILNEQMEKKQCKQARTSIRSNIIPEQGPICC